MYVLTEPQESKPQAKGIKIRTTAGVLATIFLLLAIGTTGAYFYGNKVIDEIKAVFVSHTEYWLDDTAMIIVRLADFKGDPITGADCKASLIYQNDSYMFQDENMTASTLAGNYYYSFFLNSSTYPLGIYTKQVNCTVGNKDTVISTTLHVNPALEYLKTLGNQSANISADLSEINQTTYNIYNDTQYIASNMVTATNFNAWKDNATERFDRIDGNLTLIENFCSNTETNSSELCQKLYQIYDFQQATNVTYTQYFSDINTTSTNIWNYMTGTLATNVNNIYTLLQSVNSTVVDTNVNVTNMRQDQLDEINVVIIS